MQTKVLIIVINNMRVLNFPALINDLTEAQH